MVAFVLVLAAAASFAAGIATGRTSDTLVYLSIAFSLGAFLVLAVASVRARQQEEPLEDRDWGTTRLRALDPADATGPLLEGLEEEQLDLAPSWKHEARRRWREVESPTVAVDAHLLEQALEDEEDEADFEVPVRPLVSAAPVAPDDEARWHAVVQDDAVEPLPGDLTFSHGEGLEPEPAVEEELAVEPEPFVLLDDDDVLDIREERPIDDEPLDPIDDYDDLTAAEIAPLLRGLEITDLRWVEARERSGAKRPTVLSEVEQLIADRGGTPARAPARQAAPKKAAAKKTTKRTSAKRTTAKKATSGTRASKTPRRG